MESLFTPTSSPSLKLGSVLKILKKLDSDHLTEIHAFFIELCKLLETEKDTPGKNLIPIRTIQTTMSNRAGQATRVSLTGAFVYRPHFPFPLVQAVE